jgi:hypothetical protein
VGKSLKNRRTEAMGNVWSVGRKLKDWSAGISGENLE